MKRKSKSRYNTTIGKLMFILPIIIIGSVVVYAFVSLHSPGTLVITAVTSTCEKAPATGTDSCPPLRVAATVNSQSGETPWTLSAPEGTYLVNFTSLQGYYPPDGRDVSVVPGVTAYAVGLYVPITKVVQVTASGFNATTVDAVHGITPVNWTNPSSSAVTFRGGSIGTVVLQPGQTYSYVFPAAGTYNCTVLADGYQVTDEVVTVAVS